LHAFILFCKILEGLENNKHKDIDGRKELVAMALSMNKKSFRTPERINSINFALGLSNDQILPLIPNTIKTIDSNLSDDNIAGIIDGDGSFWVSFEKSRISTGFSITVDNESIPLLIKIRQRFNNKGSIIKKTETYSVYVIRSLKDIIEVLIP
jgi:LAGLIDADG endonuclease